MYLKHIAFKKSTKMTEKQLIIIKEAILQSYKLEPNWIIIEAALKIIDNELLKH